MFALTNYATKGPLGCHSDLPSCLKLGLLNARYFGNMTSLIQGITDKEMVVACITETWMRGGREASLQEIFPQVSVCSPNPDGRGGEEGSLWSTEMRS